MASNIKVLFFDDDKSVLSAFRRFFRTSGLNDSYFTSADELISMAKSGNADLLVSDVKVPGVNTLDLLIEYKKLCTRSAIILLSGDPDSLSARNLCASIDIRNVIRKDSESAHKLKKEIEAFIEEKVQKLERTLILDKDIEDLIPSFIKDRIADCRQGVSELSLGHISEAREIAHRLKGVGKMYGFEYISQIAEEIESGDESVGREILREKFLDLISYLENVDYRFS